VTARIAVAGAGKRYVKYDDAPLLVTRALRMRGRTTRSDLWALRDVDLEVGEGECVGVIGRNGSGKSTLLRLLAGVTAPTRGRVQVRGRIAPLIAVGVGFHQELSGRENVYVNGIILGLTRAEIERRFDEIVEFADIGEFIDTPVKFYSSGMFVRLGFAVSVLAEPDVLLIDEVLAVGDVGFQLRCFERMREIRAAGTTIVLVSHNLHAVQWMCERTVLLHDGRVRHDGDTAEAISLLHTLLGERQSATGQVADDLGLGGVEVLGPDGAPTAHLHTGDRATAVLEVRFDDPVTDAVIGLNVLDEAGMLAYSEYTPWESLHSFPAGVLVRIGVEFTARLASGSYSAIVSVVGADSTVLAQSPRAHFYVDGRHRVGGIADLDATFRLQT
jgi:ABC-type polysaccharide/polyol phosphate transport system ATPase subunit